MKLWQMAGAYDEVFDNEKRSTTNVCSFTGPVFNSSLKCMPQIDERVALVRG
jgi:hypothetical protein